jgi:hypothetical protein
MPFKFNRWISNSARGCRPSAHAARPARTPEASFYTKNTSPCNPLPGQPTPAPKSARTRLPAVAVTRLSQYMGLSFLCSLANVTLLPDPCYRVEQQADETRLMEVLGGA